LLTVRDGLVAFQRGLPVKAALREAARLADRKTRTPQSPLEGRPHAAATGAIASVSTSAMVRSGPAGAP